MKSLNTKLILSALGIVAMLSSPALAQKPNRDSSLQQTTQSQVPAGQYPDSIIGMSRTGSQSNQFEHDHGYYGSNS